LFRYLNQETAKRPFRFSSQAVTCYYQSNHAKVEAIPLSALPKDTTSELAGLPLHYPFFMLNIKQGSWKSRASTEKFPGGWPTVKTRPKKNTIKPPSILSESVLYPRAQPGRGLKGLKPSLSQVKVKKQDKISDSFDLFCVSVIW